MPVTASRDTTQASVDVRTDNDAVIIEVVGNWQLEQPHPRFEECLDQIPRDRNMRRLTFDATGLEEWDSSLLIFLVQCQEYCAKHELEFDTSGLPEQVPRLLALANAVPERVQDSGSGGESIPNRIGSAAIDVWNGLIAAITFLGEVVLAVAGLFTGRVHMRWRQFWVVVQTNSSGAIPIVSLIALLVGVIIAFLGVVVLKRFGAGYYVSYLVGFGVLRELGALMTGIIIAGRTGAAFAAELGSMKITEEIDAFTTLGISPIEHLVLPRVLGLFVMMPLLTVYADFVAIAGGLVVSASLLDLSFKQFMSGLLSAVTISDAMLGIVKATIYGFIIGISGCMKGLQAGSDAGAVGRAATAAVVLAITLIILANAVVDWLAAILEA